jgi:polysaccharide biosynthesis transport protein
MAIAEARIIPGMTGGPGADLRELAGLFRRRRRLILSVVLLGTGLALLVGLQVTRKFSAEATVVIEGRQTNILDVDAVLTELTADPSTVETQINVIRSRSHVDRVIDRLDLTRDPEFNPDVRYRIGSPLKLRVSDPWRQLVGWLPENWLIASGLAEEGLEADWPIAEDARDEVARAVAGSMQVQQRGRSYVIGIRFTSSDRQKAARIANAIARLYVQDQLDSKRSATSKAASWLNQRLDGLRAELQLSEEAIERYRGANRVIDVASGELGDRERYDLRRELIDARTVLAEKQASLQLIDALRAKDESLESVPDVMSSPLFVELWRQEMELLRVESEFRNTYGVNHPRMQELIAETANVHRKMAAEIDRTVLNLENDAKVIETRIAAIEHDLDALEGVRTSSREAEVRLHQLEREAQANRELYQAFLQRYKETREQLEIVEPDVRIISEAKPPTLPSSPGPRLFALAGFTLSSLTGVLLALLLERLDRGVRSGKQLESAFGLPCLGLVPDIAAKTQARRPHQYLLSRPSSAYAESIRLAYTTLRLGHEGDPPKVIQVTSSVPGEGKTTFAVSLATSLAQSGLRVLLFDLDLRHPTVPREIPVVEAGGFVQFVAGEADHDEIVQRDPESGVDVISFKRSRHNPTRLLSSQRMAMLIGLLRSSYDRVIIDGPPLLGVSDSRILTEMADAVVFVVRWETTTLDLVRDAVKELEAAHAKIGGAVITRVDVERHALYGYGGIDSYFSKYNDYYVN